MGNRMIFKIYYLLIILCSLISCKTTDVEYMDIKHFIYKNHKYVQFENSIVHDPNCNCYEKNYNPTRPTSVR